MRLSIKDTWYTPGTDQISFGGSSSFSIDRWILDLYDLRDLNHVFRFGSVLYCLALTHMFAWVAYV